MQYDGNTVNLFLSMGEKLQDISNKHLSSWDIKQYVGQIEGFFNTW